MHGIHAYINQTKSENSFIQDDAAIIQGTE
jgi:hypothetical protein